MPQDQAPDENNQSNPVPAPKPSSSYKQDDDDNADSDGPLQIQPVSARHIQQTDENEQYSRTNSGGNSRDSAEFPASDGNNEEQNRGDDKGTSDFLFKKKELKKPRTRSFQSVLSTASLKSLKQQYVSNPPALHRNSSNAGTNSQGGIGNHKNFQSFIQAPVLSSVTNLRPGDDIQIGQQFPFDHKDSQDNSTAANNRLRVNSNNTTGTDHSGTKSNPSEDGSEAGNGPTNTSTENDEYAEETILQQQKLTLNALKKLSLSLAPIIRSDDDESANDSRQLTTRLLNLLNKDQPPQERPMEHRKSHEDFGDDSSRSKPYKPAQVDLSSFASLTRQSKHLPEEQESKKDVGSRESATTTDSEATKTNIGGLQALERDYHMGVQRQMLSMQNLINFDQNSRQVKDPGSGGYQDPQNSSELLNNSKQTPSGRYVPGHSSAGGQSQIATSLGINQHDRHGSATEPNPVLPPIDMNVRNRKVSILKVGPAKTTQAPERKLQQIKGFRSPMYVPAVLRRTDHEADLGSINEGLPNAESGPELYFEGATVPEQRQELMSSGNSIRSVDLSYSNDSVLSPSATNNIGPISLSKRQYEHIVKAAPTRKHWLRDEAVAKCGIQLCGKRFNFFERRHHCRRCGGIFCKEHTLHYLYINHLAQFTTGGRGTLSRVCDNCILEYNEFMKHEFGVSYQLPRLLSMSKSSTTSRSDSQLVTPAPSSVPKSGGKDVDYRKEVLKFRADQTKTGTPNLGGGEDRVGEQLVGSVPANWSWSSF